MEFIVLAFALIVFLFFLAKLRGKLRICVTSVGIVSLALFTLSHHLYPTHHTKLHPHGQRQPIDHVLFVKTHKTASTTVFSILAEYCRSHGLIPLMPHGYHINLFYNYWEPENMLQLLPGVPTYDMVFNHNIFLEDIFHYLHNDTFRFTILRDPYTNFMSSFNFFSLEGGFEYLTSIPGPDKLESYLKNPDNYEPDIKVNYLSFTNNRQSVDLGFDCSNHNFNDTAYIRKFIKKLEKSLDLVLITEYFDESIILLKRRLGWKTGDVLFFTKLQTPNDKKIYTKLTVEQKSILSKRTVADRTLYNHFQAVFKETLQNEVGLVEEVAEFRQVLDKLYKFCQDNGTVRTNQLVVPAGVWTDPVSVIRTKCKWLKLEEFEFTDFFKEQQSKYFNT